MLLELLYRIKEYPSMGLFKILLQAEPLERESTIVKMVKNDVFICKMLSVGWSIGLSVGRSMSNCFLHLYKTVHLSIHPLLYPSVTSK